MSKRWFCILAVLITLLGAGLRLPHLATRSLWFDETMAANNSRGSLIETVRNTRTDNSSPILYPLVLHAAQKLGHSAMIVRAPSFAASVLLIIVVLVLGDKLLGSRAALLAALLLAVAPSQIHYAQEVREYALSSLVAALMTLAYLAFLARPGGRPEKLRLWAVLAIAPLVQYGLVLYAFAILLAMVWTALADRTVSWRDIAVACAGLGATGLFSFLFTLRYQWGQDVWYLVDYLFTAGSINAGKFLLTNTLSLLTFLTPGRSAFALVVLGLALVLVLASRPCTRSIRKLSLCAGGIAIMAAVLHVYPLGSVRQCLYLAPLVCIAVAAGFEEISFPLGLGRSLRLLAVVASIFAISGFAGVINRSPYEEFEDSQAVLNQSARLATPADPVYIYYGARPAVEFYWDKEKRKNLIFGGMHRDRPENYSLELLSAIRPGTTRFWLVFSHITFSEDLRIVEDLRSAGWTVTDRLRTTGAALFEATRPPDP